MKKWSQKAPLKPWVFRSFLLVQKLISLSSELVKSSHFEASQKIRFLLLLFIFILLIIHFLLKHGGSCTVPGLEITFKECWGK